MAFSRNHAFVSGVADGADATLVRPSNWNAAVSASGAVAGGIPYFTDTTTETVTSALKFNASGAAGEGLAISAGTATTDVQALSLTQTWNNAAIAFKAVDLTITDTASASGSLALRIRGGAAGTTVLFSVDKAGGLITGNGSASAPAIGFGSALNGFYLRAGNSVDYLCNGSPQFDISAGKFSYVGTGVLGFASGDPTLSVIDSSFSRIGAGLIGIGTGSANSFAGRLKYTSAIAAGVAVGSLNASPTTGEVQSVTDALAPAVGVAVAAGGAAKALVWWNGAQWTVIGV